MFRVFVIAAAAFLVAAAATYAVVLFGTLGAWHVLGIVDRDGGGSMGLAFVIAPLIALVGGGAGAIAAGIYARRRGQGAPAGAGERRRDVSRFALVAGVLGGAVAGYLLARFAFWLAGPIRYDAMWKALLHAWAPMIVMLAGAIAGGLLTRRVMR